MSREENQSKAGLFGFLLGAAGMFTQMYATQAILPELGRAFGVGPAHAGLTVSVVVVAVAFGAWLWGPLTDRWGRKRCLVLASALIVVLLPASVPLPMPDGSRGGPHRPPERGSRPQECTPSTSRPDRRRPATT